MVFRSPIYFKSALSVYLVGYVSFSGTGEYNTSAGYHVRHETIPDQVLSQIGVTHLVFEYLNIDSDEEGDYRYLVPGKTNLMDSSRGHLQFVLGGLCRQYLGILEAVPG